MHIIVFQSLLTTFDVSIIFEAVGALAKLDLAYNETAISRIILIGLSKSVKDYCIFALKLLLQYFVNRAINN